MAQDIVALVLAGGRSRRFGREKAGVMLAGEPLVGHVAAALRAGTRQVAVNAPEGSAAAAYAKDHGLLRLPDAPGAWDGPLAGVAAGLRWAAQAGVGWLVTAPCDAPRLPRDLALRLAERAGSGGAYAVTAEGPQPLCALWSVSALELMASMRVHPPVRRLLDQLGATAVHFEDAQAFVNLNTPDAFATAEADITKGRRPAPSPPEGSV